MKLTEEQKQKLRDGLSENLHINAFDFRLAQASKGVDVAVQIVESVLACQDVPEVWRPEPGEGYYTINLHNPDVETVLYSQNHSDPADVIALRAANMFRTKEKAEAVAKWQKAQRELFGIAEAVNGVGWSPGEVEDVWVIYHECGRWRPCAWSLYRFGAIVFRSKEAAQCAIEMMGSRIDNLLLRQ